MFGVAPRSSRISLKVPFSSGLSANTRHTSPLVMTGRSLPYFAVSDSTACPTGEAPGGTAGDVLAIEGWVSVGWIRGAGRFGPAPGPEGGARFMAGPAAGASGTKAGGTGGGRSENSWAEAKPGASVSKTTAKSARPGPKARPRPSTPLPLQIMAMLFTENAANSSLRDPGGWPLVGTPRLPQSLTDKSRSSRILVCRVSPLRLFPSGINHARDLDWRHPAGAA